MSRERTFSVLVVDDVEDLRELVRIVLERSGRFRVVGEAADGLQAVKLAEQIRPDLVLLDLAMPEMDGLEALPHILTASEQSKVVILSGFEEKRMAPIALGQGALAYLEKDLKPRELVRRLLEALDSK